MQACIILIFLDSCWGPDGPHRHQQSPSRHGYGSSDDPLHVSSTAVYLGIYRDPANFWNDRLYWLDGRTNPRRTGLKRPNTLCGSARSRNSDWSHCRTPSSRSYLGFSRPLGGIQPGWTLWGWLFGLHINVTPNTKLT